MQPIRRNPTRKSTAAHQTQDSTADRTATQDPSAHTATDPIPTPGQSTTTLAPQTMQIHPVYQRVDSQGRLHPIKLEPQSSQDFSLHGAGGMEGEKEEDQQIFKHLINPAAAAQSMNMPPNQGVNMPMRRDSRNNTPVGMMGVPQGYLRAPTDPGVYYMDAIWGPPGLHSPPLHYASPNPGGPYHPGTMIPGPPMVPIATINPRPPPSQQVKESLWDVAQYYLRDDPPPPPSTSEAIKSRFIPADYHHIIEPPHKDLTLQAVQFDINELPPERRNPNAAPWTAQSEEAAYELLKQLQSQMAQGTAGEGANRVGVADGRMSAGPTREIAPARSPYGSASASGSLDGDHPYASSPAYPTNQPPSNANSSNGSANGSGAPTTNGVNPGTGVRGSPGGWPRPGEAEAGWNPSGPESAAQFSPTRASYPAPPGWQHSQPSSAHPDRAPTSPTQYWRGPPPPPHTISSPTRQTWSGPPPTAQAPSQPQPPQMNPMPDRPPHPGMARWPGPGWSEHSIAHVPGSRTWSATPHGLANPPSGTLPLDNIDGRADEMRWTTTPVTATPSGHPWDASGGEHPEGRRRANTGTAQGRAENGSPTTWSPHHGPGTHPPWVTEGHNPNANVPPEGRLQTPGGTGAGPHSHPSGSQTQPQSSPRQPQPQAPSSQPQMNHSMQPSQGMPPNQGMQPNQGQFAPGSYGMYPPSQSSAPGQGQGQGQAGGREIPYGSQPDSVASYPGGNGGERPPGPGQGQAHPHHNHGHGHGGNPYPPIPMTPSTGSAPYGTRAPPPSTPQNNPNPMGNPSQMGHPSGMQPGLHHQPPPNPQANVYPNVYSMHPSQQPGSMPPNGMMPEYAMFSAPGGGPPPPITYPLNPNTNAMGQRLSANQGPPNPSSYPGWSYGRSYEDGRMP